MSDRTVEVMLVMRYVCWLYLDFLVDCVGCTEVVFKCLSNWVMFN